MSAFVASSIQITFPPLIIYWSIKYLSRFWKVWIGLAISNSFLLFSSCNFFVRFASPVLSSSNSLRFILLTEYWSDKLFVRSSTSLSSNSPWPVIKAILGFNGVLSCFMALVNSYSNSLIDCSKFCPELAAIWFFNSCMATSLAPYFTMAPGTITFSE